MYWQVLWCKARIRRSESSYGHEFTCCVSPHRLGPLPSITSSCTVHRARPPRLLSNYVPQDTVLILFCQVTHGDSYQSNDEVNNPTTFRMSPHLRLVVCPSDVRNVRLDLCVIADKGLNTASINRCSPGSSTPKPSAGLIVICYHNVCADVRESCVTGKTCIWGRTKHNHCLFVFFF